MMRAQDLLTVIGAFCVFLFLEACSSPTGDGLCNEGAAGRSILFRVTDDVQHEKYPFMVNVVSRTTNTHICSGVLIGHDLVLVPASCVSKKCEKSEPFPIVRTNSSSIEGKDVVKDVEERNVIQQRVHIKFNGSASGGYDAAVLQLDRKIENAHSVINAYKGLRDLGDADVVMMLGWFKASRIGAPSATLQLITGLEYISQENCTSVFHELPEATVCAKPKMRAHCEWDHGAPLVLCTTGIGNHTLAGLASFERSTCQTDDPYVYVDVGGDLLYWVEAHGLEDSVIEEPPKEYLKNEL